MIKDGPKLTLVFQKTELVLGTVSANVSLECFLRQLCFVCGKLTTSISLV